MTREKLRAFERGYKIWRTISVRRDGAKEHAELITKRERIETSGGASLLPQSSLSHPPLVSTN